MKFNRIYFIGIFYMLPPMILFIDFHRSFVKLGSLVWNIFLITLQFLHPEPPAVPVSVSVPASLQHRCCCCVSFSPDGWAIGWVSAWVPTGDEYFGWVEFTGWVFAACRVPLWPCSWPWPWPRLMRSFSFPCSFSNTTQLNSSQGQAN